MALARLSRVYKALSDSEVASLVAGASFLQAEPGDVLAAQGRAPTALYTVIVGELDAVVTYGDGQTRVDRRVQSLRSGMTFGEEALVDGLSAATVVACSTCELAAVRPIDGKLVLAQSPDLRAALARPAEFARPPLIDLLLQAPPSRVASVPVSATRWPTARNSISWAGSDCQAEYSVDGRGFFPLPGGGPDLSSRSGV